MFFSRLGEGMKIVLRFSADVYGVAKHCFLHGEKQLLAWSEVASCVVKSSFLCGEK